MLEHMGRRTKGHQQVRSLLQAEHPVCHDLLEDLVLRLVERQVEPLDLMAVLQKLPLQPLDDEPRAAVDERHEG